MLFIKENGYDYSRSAFFPLFPAIWKITALAPFGISMVNGIFFLFSCSLLAKDLKLTIPQLVSFLAIPSFVFMFLPYSESFLFLFAVIFYLSLKRERLWLGCLALFLMSVTKPTASIFLPAILIAEYLGQTDLKSIYRRTFFFTMSVIAGNVLVFYVQFLALGEWLTFFEAQAEWGNRLSVPVIPLTTWNHPHVIWIDSVALWICILSAVLVCYLTWRRIVKGLTFSRTLSYAVLYLAGTGFFVLLFRGGHLFSLNRFVFATPFVVIATMECKKQFKMESSIRVVIGLAISFLVFSLLFGCFLHIRLLMLYTLLAIIVGLWFNLYFNRSKKIWAALLILVMIGIQLFYLIAILKGEWLA